MRARLAIAAAAALVATAAAHPAPQALDVPPVVTSNDSLTANAPLTADAPAPAKPAPTAATPSPAPRPIALPASASRNEESAARAGNDEARPIAKPSGNFTGDAIRTGLALVGVLVLIFVFRWVLRRVGDPLAARRPSGVVQVLSRFPLAKGQTILLLEVGRRVLCVHQSATGAATLCAFDDLTEIADLKARIEAGSSERAAFERQLVHSLERERPAVANAPRELLLESAETVDLTKRRGRAAATASRGVAGRIGVVA
ncbi:MAG: FliO/MopB family protein [Phycisphaerae bacterium]|nr:FliO/MopB family protein [Phycisphaerae bacterium]